MNQYTSIARPRTFDVIARAPYNLDIFVDYTYNPPTRQGNYHRLEAEASDWNYWSHVYVHPTPPASGPIVSGYRWIPKSMFYPTYDLDGNLLNDGRWHYTWDAENRLVRMTVTDDAAAAGVPATKIEFAYDWMGRRLAKKVSSTTAFPIPAHDHASWVATTDTRFAYDEWNIVSEFNALSGFSVARQYLWGTDLSGTEQGAGGVGGLLSISNGGTPYIPAYDGNGNVMAWMNSSGTTVSRSDYDPFGNKIIHEGVDIPVGFSTKYEDRETGLLYYGYRYYDPVHGRWPSRDPIEEEGGINLYGMVGNDPVNFVDILGLAWDSAKGVEAIDLAKKVKADPTYVVPASHPCCTIIKSCATGDCITFAAGVIRCGYLLNGDKAMADKFTKFNKDTFNASEVSKLLESDGWKLVVYAKDSRRVHARYTGNDVLLDPKFKTGEKMAGTFGAAVNQLNLYGMTVHGAIYDLDPYAIKGEGARGAYSMPTESFAFLSATEGYHTGLYAGTTVYHSPGLLETDMKGWVNLYDATQIGWMMLAPDSQSNLATYKKMLDAKKNHRSPKVLDKDQHLAPPFP